MKRSFTALIMITLLITASSAFAADIKYVSIDVSSPSKYDVLLLPEDRTAQHTGKMREGAPITEGDTEKFNLYNFTYRVISGDQWDAHLYRYASVKNEDGSITVKRIADLADTLMTHARGNRVRDIFYYVPGAGTSPVKLNPDDTTLFSSLTAMGPNDVLVRSIDEDSRPKNVPFGTPAGVDPSRAWFAWIQSSDLSHTLSSSGDSAVSFERRYLLTDPGQSEPILYGPPSIVDSLPSYRDWASLSTSRARNRYVIAQTNDGLLHIVNADNMNEQASVILPPMMLPHRLMSLKTDAERRWIDISDSSMLPRSRPMYLNDGALQLSYMDLSNKFTPNTKWGTYLLGTLGRGGNGIYMMDMEDPTAPKLKWYVENICRPKAIDAANNNMYNTENTIINWNERSSGQDSIIAEHVKEFKWLDLLLVPKTKNGMPGDWKFLGWNSPKPLVTTVGQPDTNGGIEHKLRQIIILPGGIKTNIAVAGMDDTIGADEYNGLEGSALFVIDPADGKILRMFNSATLPANYEELGVKEGDYSLMGFFMACFMGMMNSEVSLLRSENTRYVTSKAFAVDNIGYVFMFNFDDLDEQNIDSTDDPSKWTVSKLANIGLPPSAHLTSAMTNYSVPHGVILSREKFGDDIRISGATADVYARTDLGGDPVMSNDVPLMFSFTSKLDKKANYQTRDDWKEIKLDSNDSFFTQEDAEAGKTGWFGLMQKENNIYRSEQASARGIVVDGILLIPTYLSPISNAEPEARLYALDVNTGQPILWGGDQKKKYVRFGGIRISGFTVSELGDRKSVIVTYDKVAANDDVDSQINSEERMQDVKGEGSDVDAFVIDFGSNEKPNFKDASSVLLYWLER